ncbi:MAG: prepilin-type N-terminal cleavage/methylation domain-containing protein [Acidobacteriota bacterium]
MRRGTRRRSASGMSLVELLVAIFLTGVVLIGGAFLLINLTKRSATELAQGPALPDAAGQVLDRLVRELRPARGRLTSLGEFTADSGALIFVTAEGDTMLYVLDEASALWRYVLPEGEDTAQGRRLIENVDYWSHDTRDGYEYTLTLRAEGGEAAERRVVLRAPRTIAMTNPVGRGR